MDKAYFLMLSKVAIFSANTLADPVLNVKRTEKRVGSMKGGLSPFMSG